jgi:predicted negative regulator of RcsB-dependent stress response
MTASVHPAESQIAAPFAAALGDFNEALTLVDPETEPGFYGVVLHDIADVYKAAGEPEKAAAAYQDAISHKQRADNPSDLVTTMIVYSDFLIDHNDLTEARSILDQTSQLLTKSMGRIKPAAMAVYFYDLGGSYENLGGEGHDDAYTEALAAYDTAQQLLDPAADPGSYSTVMKHIAGVHQAQGRLTEAVAAYQEAVDHIRHVSGASSSVASLLVDLGRLRRKIAQLGVKNA